MELTRVGWQAGWEEVLDPTTGKMFYAHAASKTTSWERPTQ